MKKRKKSMIRLNLMRVKEIVRIIKTETKEVSINKTSLRITKEKSKMGKLEREAEEVAEVAKTKKVVVIIKRKNIIMKKDQSIKTRKSTKRNQQDKFLMIQTTQSKKRKKTEKEIHIREREVVVEREVVLEDNK